MDNGCDIKELFFVTAGPRELTMFSCFSTLNYLIKHLLQAQIRPPLFNVIASFPSESTNAINYLIGSATELTPIPTGTNTIFRVYNIYDKVSLNCHPALPFFQLRIEGSGRTIYMVKYQTDVDIVNKLSLPDVATLVVLLILISVTLTYFILVTWSN